MNEEIKNKYDFPSWGQNPEEITIVLTNFVPWPEDCLGWNRTSLEFFTEAETRQLRRTIWDDPQNSDSRVLIDVYETPSFSQAQEYLIELLANNQLERLPDGPKDLGRISFIHPEGVAPAAFWIRGNLCLSIHSFGRKMVDAIEWSHRLDSRILDKPEVDRFTVTLSSEEERVNVEQEVEISFSFPWQIGEDGYCKFFATGGDLYFKGKQLYFRANNLGEAVIEALALEAGRESYGGVLRLKVE